MEKQKILDEIKRTAAENDGVPIGRLRFFTETGIKESDWRGRYWVRWNDAVREAGFTPNKKTKAYDEDLIFGKLIEVIRDLGHFPVFAELKIRKQKDKSFPEAKTFQTRGSKRELIAQVIGYCRNRPDMEDVISICETELAEAPEKRIDSASNSELQEGFVYLLKYGSNYKIGRTSVFGRRERELAIQLPEKANKIHMIKTDDSVGIEAYWHERFASKRKNGEWFALNSQDVKAFKRRKFM